MTESPKLQKRLSQSRFQGCTGLTELPKNMLPATTLAVCCYTNMFDGCTNLVKAPDLPAPTLDQNSYKSMFLGCNSLKAITCLATNISANWCLANWVEGVAASGTFTKAASMEDWPTGTAGIPTGWEVVNADN